MEILILSSSKEEINPYYTSIAKSIAHYLAKDDNDLIFGGASTSMMGICYDEFKKNNRNISAYTTETYINDLENLDAAKHYVCQTTFEMKQRMFDNADLIICLPGGPGSISELTSFIEEKRSNDKDVPLIIYDESNFFEHFYKMYDYFIENKFVSEDIKNMWEVAKNKEEFEMIYSKYKYSRKR